MEAKIDFEISIEGLDSTILGLRMAEYFFLKMELKTAKDKRRGLHENGKCDKEVGSCLNRNEEGEYYSNPDLSTACDFCKERHVLYLKIKELSGKCRGIMTKVKRQIVRMESFKKLTIEHEKSNAKNQQS